MHPEDHGPPRRCGPTSAASCGYALIGAALAVGMPGAALGEEPGGLPPDRLADVVVSATRTAERSFDLPVSITRLDGQALRDGQLGVNLSESMAAVPGVSVQNRQNYAQDLQVSVRGFGARSSFGVRGVRLYADGIPGTMPDGQGQFSHFDLGSADRIEVMRGPFSALYGNSSGGVISIYTEDGRPGPGVVGTATAGSLGTVRYGFKADDAAATTNFVLSAAHFETDGYRDHSRAERNTANLKVGIATGERSTLTLVANAIVTPDVEDPLGLTHSQLAADPTQAGTNAVLYNTRKSLEQEQVGATLATTLTDADELSAMLYGGRRATTQFQAILRAAQAAVPTHPGGVIDLGREYQGTDVHVTDRRSPGGTSLVTTIGVSFDALQEARRGFLNYSGTELGVVGALRRNDRNRVDAADQYLQLEWDPAERWRAIAGLRHSDVRVSSRDETGTVAPTEVRYGAVNPVAGITYRVSTAVNTYVSYGRGFETPTLNDLAYRSTDGSLPGLNVGLLPAHSDNFEVGIKTMVGALRADLAAFYIQTLHELAVQSNSGGRSVYQNIDGTRRTGAEAALAASWAHGLDARLAYTHIRAVTSAPYQSCAGLPCAPVTIPEGNYLPAVPVDAVYAGLTWRSMPAGLATTLETVGRSKIYVDDRNSDAAAAYWSTNLRAELSQRGDGWELTETVRVDNIADRHYVDTVIVNESNSRYFEPDPGRTAYLLLTFAYR